MARTTGGGAISSSSPPITSAGEVTQRMRALDRGAYLGGGKREELKALVAQVGAEIVLVDHELSPSQARNPSTASTM